MNLKQKSLSPHALNWFEIPANDLERAFQFYNSILPNRVRKGTFFGIELVLFSVPFNTGEAVGGSIVARPDLKPTTEGPIIYINTFGQLDEALARVEAAGGSVVVPKMDLGNFGHSAMIIDSEGNKVGLHQN